MARIYINSALEKTSDSFQLRGDDVPVTISAKGLAGVEVVKVQCTQDSGGTWFDLNDGGTAVQLSVGTNITALCVPGTFRFYKAATAGTVVVALASDRLGL